MPLGMGGGSTTVGTGVVKVKPDAEGFGTELDRQVQREGNAGASRAGAATSAAFKGAFFAGAAGIAKGVFDFANFDEGMREVFTLMPDITDDAMSEMSDQVKDFAGEFGVLPTEVIPALYDSLSAGVPAGNVFEFLETSQKLARGGATDLATAVDALTSVTNAYGPEALDAARASDILFTAVKQGKTTVDEMSASLFQVAPIASSFGVSFEEASAAIATLTAQGTPTSVAATQIKGAIAELGKEGTKAAKAFEAAAGQTFPQFIEEGGNLTEALVLMQQSADESGGSIVDMFGSIEAGQAALGITGDVEGMTAALDEMNNSAGATDEAFETMSEGMAATLDRLKAQFSVALLNLGESLAPTVDTLGQGLLKLIEAFTALPEPMQTVIVLGGTLLAGVMAFSGPILRTIQLFGMLNKAMLVLAANPWVLVVAALAAAAFLVWKNWDTITAAVGAAWDWMTGKAEEVGEYLRVVWETVTGAVSAAFDSMLSTITDVTLSIVNIVTDTMDTITNVVTTAFNAVGDVISTVGGGVVDFFTGIPRTITSAFTGLADLIAGPFRAAFDGIKAAWNNTVGGFGFTTPDWIPFVGGKSFTVPSMATGGVAANPMLAMIGDAGPRDPEIVSPVSLMRETVTDAMSSAGAGGDLIIEGPLIGNATISNEQDAVTLSRELYREIEQRRRASGVREATATAGSFA